MIEFILNNKDWILPILAIILNEAGKLIPTNKDYDIFKAISWLLQFFLSKNKGKTPIGHKVGYNNRNMPDSLKWIERNVRRDKITSLIKLNKDESN